MIDDTIEIPIFVPKPRVFNGMEGDETLALPSHHHSIGKNKMAKLRPCRNCENYEFKPSVHN
jgi:hypothetical protein